MGIKAVSLWVAFALALVTASGYYFGFNYETTLAYLGVGVVAIIVLGAELIHNKRK